MTPDFPFSPFYTHSRKGRRSRGGKGGETRRLRNDSEFCAPRTRAQRAQENSCCRSLYCLAPPPRRLGASNCPFPPTPAPIRALVGSWRAGRFPAPLSVSPDGTGPFACAASPWGCFKTSVMVGATGGTPSSPRRQLHAAVPALLRGGGRVTRPRPAEKSRT